MAQPDFSKAVWRKSDTSGDGGCVEVAYSEGVVGVRDTKQAGAGPVLVFNEREWSAFLDGVHGGQFEWGKLAE